MKLDLFVLGLGIAAALCGPAQAQEFSPKTAGTRILDLRLTDVDPDAGDAITTTAGASTGLRVRASNDVMPTVGVTYFLTDHLAVEAIAGTTQHTIRAQGGSTDVKVKDTWVLPPVVTLQYHFAPSARFSPYVGAGLNYMLFYSGKDRNGFHLTLDDGVGFALQGGADVAISGPWSLDVDVKKIFFKTDAVDRLAGIKSKVHLDPWVASAGFGYRF